MFKLLHNSTHFTCYHGNAQNPSSLVSTVCELKTSRCMNWIQERQRNQRSNCQHPLDHRKSKRIPGEKIYFCFIDYTKAFDYVGHIKLWKILKEMGIPDHVTYLLRNLCRSRSNSQNWTWTSRLVSNRERSMSELVKEYVKAIYCHPAYLTSMQSTSCEMLGWINTSWSQDYVKEY